MNIQHITRLAHELQSEMSFIFGIHSPEDH